MKKILEFFLTEGSDFEIDKGKGMSYLKSIFYA
jgi:hypothetical protein